MPLGLSAQTREVVAVADSDSTVAIKANMLPDSLSRRPKRDWKTWRPDPKRALWLALVLPGAGQSYTMRWNNQMYHDYSQAYLDIMDDDPSTHSYDSFLHLGVEITQDNLSRYQELFRKRKDRYRRWRDLSFFCLVGVYALSVVDAYVDASLSEFDISNDLSMKLSPAVINAGGAMGGYASPLKNNAVGVACSLTF